MATEHSPLTLVLADLLERGFGVTGHELRDSLEAIVASHALDGDKAPTWMFELFTRILNRRLTPMSERYEIPSGYPLGGSGLANLLLGLDEAIGSLGVDEQGESLEWSIPELKIHVRIIREWRGPGEGVVIEALQ